MGKRAFVIALVLCIVAAVPFVKGDAAPASQYTDSMTHADYSAYAAPAPGPLPSYGPPAAPAPIYGPGQSQSVYANEPYRGYHLDSESPFVQQRLFNTAVAMTVPLFSFTLPQRSSPSGGVDLANQFIFGVFAVFVVILVFAVPVLFTRPPSAVSGRSSDRDGILNHLMANNKVFNFMGADLSNKVGLDTTSCLQKTICEANRTPKKYGMLATPFQMFFPPPTNGTESHASIFQLAAKEGKYSHKDCGKAYKCFFDIMDLASYGLDWWKYSSDPNYVMEF